MVTYTFRGPLIAPPATALPKALGEAIGAIPPPAVAYTLRGPLIAPQARALPKATGEAIGILLPLLEPAAPAVTYTFRGALIVSIPGTQKAKVDDVVNLLPLQTPPPTPPKDIHFKYFLADVGTLMGR